VEWGRNTVDEVSKCEEHHLGCGLWVWRGVERKRGFGEAGQKLRLTDCRMHGPCEAGFWRRRLVRWRELGQLPFTITGIFDSRYRSWLIVVGYLLYG
jgi:hypothetical protein